MPTQPTEHVGKRPKLSQTLSSNASTDRVSIVPRPFTPSLSNTSNSSSYVYKPPTRMLSNADDNPFGALLSDEEDSHHVTTQNPFKSTASGGKAAKSVGKKKQATNIGANGGAKKADRAPPAPISSEPIPTPKATFTKSESSQQADNVPCAALSDPTYPRFLSTFAFAPDQITPHYVHPAHTSCPLCSHTSCDPVLPLPPVHGPPVAFSLHMRAGETLTFIGAAKIVVAAGAIECGGAIITPHNALGYTLPGAAAPTPLLTAGASVCPPLPLPAGVVPHSGNAHEVHSASWVPSSLFTIRALPVSARVPPAHGCPADRVDADVEGSDSDASANYESSHDEPAAHPRGYSPHPDYPVVILLFPAVNPLDATFTATARAAHASPSPLLLSWLRRAALVEAQTLLAISRGLSAWVHRYGDSAKAEVEAAADALVCSGQSTALTSSASALSSNALAALASVLSSLAAAAPMPSALQHCANMLTHAHASSSSAENTSSASRSSSASTIATNQIAAQVASSPPHTLTPVVSLLALAHTQLQHRMLQTSNYLRSPLLSPGLHGFLPLLHSRAPDAALATKLYSSLAAGAHWRAAMNALVNRLGEQARVWMAVQAVLAQGAYPTNSPSDVGALVHADGASASLLPLTPSLLPAPPRPACVMLCGARNHGKSSFTRMLLHRLLDCFPAVAVLETDVGQSEFTPPGLVSLLILTRPTLSPPASHQRWSAGSVFATGANTPGHDPVAYLGAVRAAYEVFLHGLSEAHAQTQGGVDVSASVDVHDTSAGDADKAMEDTVSTAPHPASAPSSPRLPSPFIPLLVNTPGWVTGLGKTLAAHIVHVTAPQHVVELADKVHSAAKDSVSRGDISCRSSGDFFTSDMRGEAVVAPTRSHALPAPHAGSGMDADSTMCLSAASLAVSRGLRASQLRGTGWLFEDMTEEAEEEERRASSTPGAVLTATADATQTDTVNASASAALGASASTTAVDTAKPTSPKSATPLSTIRLDVPSTQTPASTLPRRSPIAPPSVSVPLRTPALSVPREDALADRTGCMPAWDYRRYERLVGGRVLEGVDGDGDGGDGEDEDDDDIDGDVELEVVADSLDDLVHSQSTAAPASDDGGVLLTSSDSASPPHAESEPLPSPLPFSSVAATTTAPSDGRCRGDCGETCTGGCGVAATRAPASAMGDWAAWDAFARRAGSCINGVSTPHTHTMSFAPNIDSARTVPADTLVTAGPLSLSSPLPSAHDPLVYILPRWSTDTPLPHDAHLVWREWYAHASPSFTAPRSPLDQPAHTRPQTQSPLLSLPAAPSLALTLLSVGAPVAFCGVPVTHSPYGFVIDTVNTLADAVVPNSGGSVADAPTSPATACIPPPASVASTLSVELEPSVLIDSSWGLSMMDHDSDDDVDAGAEPPAPAPTSVTQARCARRFPAPAACTTATGTVTTSVTVGSLTTITAVAIPTLAPLPDQPLSSASMPAYLCAIPASAIDGPLPTLPPLPTINNAASSSLPSPDLRTLALLAHLTGAAHYTSFTDDMRAAALACARASAAAVEAHLRWLRCAQTLSSAASPLDLLLLRTCTRTVSLPTLAAPPTSEVDVGTYPRYWHTLPLSYYTASTILAASPPFVIPFERLRAASVDQLAEHAHTHERQHWHAWDTRPSVALSARQDGSAAVGEPLSDAILAAVNGCVVALCSSSYLGATARTSQDCFSALLPHVCMGMALVRAVDLHSRLIYLCSPIPEHLTEFVDLLVPCAPSVAALPPFAQHLQHCPTPAPYVSCLVGKHKGAGANQMKSRNNIVRASTKG